MNIAPQITLKTIEASSHTLLFGRDYQSSPFKTRNTRVLAMIGMAGISGNANINIT